MADKDTILKQLYDSYYTDEAESQGLGALSSHWRHYSDMFNVRFSADGEVEALEGIGFGVYKYNSMVARLLDKICIWSYLPTLPRGVVKQWWSLSKMARLVCDRMGIDLTYDIFRQVCTLSLIISHMGDAMRARPLRLLMIGDGYGVLSSLFKQVFPHANIVMVDIGKTLFFQAYYCQKAHPERGHCYIGKDGAEQLVDFVYCPADRLPFLEHLSFDIAINVNSMQEMNTGTIAGYFSFLRKNLFYCCNRERNDLRGGEVVEFRQYPWSSEDVVLLEEYCPWQRYFLAVNWPQKGIELGPIKLPIVNYFTGKALHRLSVLETL
jgi:hypothetical protein